MGLRNFAVSIVSYMIRKSRAFNFLKIYSLFEQICYNRSVSYTHLLLVSFLTVAVFVGFKTGYKISVSETDLIWVIVLGLINTSLGCYFYFSSIGNLPVQTVAICGYIEPLSAVILSALILGETMFPLQIVGAILIIGCLLYTSRCV